MLSHASYLERTLYNAVMRSTHANLTEPLARDAVTKLRIPFARAQVSPCTRGRLRRQTHVLSFFLLGFPPAQASQQVQLRIAQSHPQEVL